MWIDKGIDVVQAEKMCKALLTTHVFLGNTEAEAMGLASMEIVKSLPALAATMAPTGKPPPLPLCQSTGGG